MFKIVLLICFGVATAFPNSFYSEDVPSYRELTCRDYVLDKCTIELDGLLESVKDTTEENCQKYCSMVYEGVCQFFIYDRKQRICNLLKQPIENYAKTCIKVAGPKSPSLEDCVADVDPCNSFLEGYCRLEGNLIDNLEQIESQKICQFACLFSDRCEFFLYDIETKNCELFDSEIRDCDLIRGPPEPALDTCLSNPTSTTESETTTLSDF